MPSGTPRYFEQLEAFSDRTTPDSPEFEAKMRQLVGQGYQGTINKNAAANVADPATRYNLRGFNTEDAKASDISDDYKQLDKGIPSLIESGKHVFGVGAGARPKTFAHEFRHDEVKNETTNRIQDLLNASSYPDYINSLTKLYADMGKDEDLVYRANAAMSDVISPNGLPLRKMEDELFPAIKNHLRYSGPNDAPVDFKNLSSQRELNRGEYEMNPVTKALSKVGVIDTVPYKNTDVRKQLLVERNYYPGLHFIGKVEDGIKSKKELELERQSNEQAEIYKKLADALEKINAKDKKASGGSIELPNTYRPGGRTRMI